MSNWSVQSNVTNEVQLPFCYFFIRRTTVWAAILLFSPRLSTFSWVFAFRFTTDGSAPSSRDRLERIDSLCGLSFGLWRIKVASKFPSSYPASSISFTWYMDHMFKGWGTKFHVGKYQYGILNKFGKYKQMLQ